LIESADFPHSTDKQNESSSRLNSGTLADALTERDVLKLRGAAYRELAATASTTQARTTRSEVKFVSTVSVAATERRADDLAKELRQLDSRIQEADWKTDLLDSGSHSVGPVLSTGARSIDMAYYRVLISGRRPEHPGIFSGRGGEILSVPAQDQSAGLNGAERRRRGKLCR